MTSPHDNASWAALDEMVANAEAFYQVCPRVQYLDAVTSKIWLIVARNRTLIGYVLI